MILKLIFLQAKPITNAGGCLLLFVRERFQCVKGTVLSKLFNILTMVKLFNSILRKLARSIHSINNMGLNKNNQLLYSTLKN